MSNLNQPGLAAIKAHATEDLIATLEIFTVNCNLISIEDTTLKNGVKTATY